MNERRKEERKKEGRKEWKKQINKKKQKKTNKERNKEQRTKNEKIIRSNSMWVYNAHILIRLTLRRPLFNVLMTEIPVYFHYA